MTGDKTLQYEQNMEGRKVGLVSLSAISWPIMEPYVAKIVEAVDAVMPGSFTPVDVGKFARLRERPAGPWQG